MEHFVLVKVNFNPHSREGSDDVTDWIDEGIGISIHTPAKGVTQTGYVAGDVTLISIHTPAKGVTSPAGQT